MTNPNLPSVEYLHKRLRLDAETGKLFWRDCDSMPQRWRSRYAGKEAFTATTVSGYKHGAINDKIIYAHKAIWAMHHGAWAEDKVDHISGDKCNNRMENLRAVSQSENMRNACKRSDNTSGICGVVWHKVSKKWKAQMQVDGKAYYLGVFPTIEEAAAVRAAASREHGFTERHGT